MPQRERHHVVGGDRNLLHTRQPPKQFYTMPRALFGVEAGGVEPCGLYVPLLCWWCARQLLDGRFFISEEGPLHSGPLLSDSPLCRLLRCRVLSFLCCLFPPFSGPAKGPLFPHVAGVRCNVVACVPRVTPSSSSLRRGGKDDCQHLLLLRGSIDLLALGGTCHWLSHWLSHQVESPG
jgi:hypothetical protein